MMRSIGLTSALILLGCGTGAVDDPAVVDDATEALVTAFDDAAADRVLSIARQQLGRTVAVMPSTSYPKATNSSGAWTTVPNTDLVGWTQGFFPGAMWFLHASNGDAAWRTRADTWTRNLELQKTNTQTHDLGFKLFNSFEPGYRLTGNPYYRGVLLTAAQSLASRYRPTIGIIECCDWNSEWQMPLVVDTMMNLELLLWASQNGGRPEWRDMAVSHALKTLADLVRADGSTYHVVDYDPSTGAVRFKRTYQGYSDESTWTRGQAWAVYGYTMVYRYTGDARMLAAAQRTADYYLNRLGSDPVPNWDFDAPTQKKDSSAAAIVASALLELSTLVSDAAVQARYRDAALQMLGALASSEYLVGDTSSYGILRHGVGNLPAGHEIDVSLIYGDYYLLEAVTRYQQLRTSRAISMGGTWRYDDRGVDPGAAWTSLGFDDSSWRSGPGQLGYGEGDEATVLQRRSPAQPSLYFRKKVVTSGPVRQAALRVLHDDGVAVWVNGTLVFSEYMGRGTSHSVYASASSADNELDVVSLSPGAFREGENIIAVMIKQSSSTSSDVSFDLELTLTTARPGPARLTVVSPNGGEQLSAGQIHPIAWTSSGASSTVRIDFSSDGGGTWSPVTGSTPNTGQYAWTVPAVVTSNGRIRITDAANGALTDTSDGGFSIAAGSSTVTAIPLGSTWRYDDRNVDPGPQWTTAGFNDSTWPSGPAQLGYGDGDERTVLRRTSPAQPSVYFRKKIIVSGAVSRADLTVVHDDGVAVWVNGTLVFSRYVGSTSHGAYASQASADNQRSTASLSTAPFIQGENVIAVMVKQGDGGSSDVSFDLGLTLTISGGGGGEPPPTEETTVPIPLRSGWRFDDLGVDRGTAWLQPSYDDAGWKTGTAHFGYGDGDEATLLRRTSPVLPSYYFRKRITVSGTVTRAQLRVIFDDAFAVWVNGRLVMSRNMNNGTSYSVYAGAWSADNEVASGTIDLGANPFVAGENVIAVMVKQGDSGSSDVSFDLELTLTTRR